MFTILEIQCKIVVFCNAPYELHSQLQEAEIIWGRGRNKIECSSCWRTLLQRNAKSKFPQYDWRANCCLYSQINGAFNHVFWTIVHWQRVHLEHWKHQFLRQCNNATRLLVQDFKSALIQKSCTASGETFVIAIFSLESIKLTLEDKFLTQLYCCCQLGYLPTTRAAERIFPGPVQKVVTGP